MDELEELAEDAAPISSVEKLRGLLDGAGSVQAHDEEEAQTLSMLRLAGPVALRMVPSDPVKLDAMLASLARWALQLRSDGAQLAATMEEFLAEPSAVDTEAVEDE